tara:strand:- start:523 stop:1527 length:1005 start_codon:yes stop_codon:yes gene_type:complete
MAKRKRAQNPRRKHRQTKRTKGTEWMDSIHRLRGKNNYYFKIISKFVPNMSEALSNSKNDRQLQQYLSRNPSSTKQKNKQLDLSRLAEKTLYIIRSAVGRNATYMDIGAGDGIKTAGIRDAFGIKSSDTTCLETGDTVFDVIKEKDNKICTLRRYNGRNLPYSSGSLGVASCLQVLHHVGHADALIKEIARVLIPGGIFILQDHDVISNDKKLPDFLRAIHFIYASLNDEDVSRLKPSKYRSASIYDAWCERHGLERVQRITKKYSSTRTFYAIYRKKTEDEKSLDESVDESVPSKTNLLKTSYEQAQKKQTPAERCQELLAFVVKHGRLYDHR